MKITKDKNSIMIEFDDVELSILSDSLVEPLAWFETVAAEKLANCKRRLITSWVNKFQAEKSIESIPTDDGKLLGVILASPAYKSRADRDAANKE